MEDKKATDRQITNLMKSCTKLQAAINSDGVWLINGKPGKKTKRLLESIIKQSRAIEKID